MLNYVLSINITITKSTLMLKSAWIIKEKCGNKKGNRPADVLSVVTDKSVTTSTISIHKNSENVNLSGIFSKNDFRFQKIQ